MKTALVTFCTSCVLAVGSLHAATNLTLVVGKTMTNAVLNLRAGQLAEILYAKLGYIYGYESARVTVSFGEDSFRVENYYGAPGNVYGPSTTDRMPAVAGPATITLTGIAPQGGYCTIRVTDLDGSFTPSNAVVIPADATGPVNIILESSADLVTWSAAQPGTYAGSTAKRFFRVRAEKN